MAAAAAAKHVVLFPFPGQGHLSAFMSLAGLLHSALPDAAITFVSTPRNVASLQTSAWSNAPFLGFHALPFTPADHGLPPDCESSDAVQPGAIAFLLVAFESLEAAFDDYLNTAISAAAGGGLEHQRVADPVGGGQRPVQIALGLLVLVVYGGLLWGALPGQAGVSWQGHLFGAVGGGLAAGHPPQVPRRAPLCLR